jgi:hypothetical protein
MDRRDRAVRWLRLRYPRVLPWTRRGTQERDRLGVSRVESQGGGLCELWLLVVILIGVAVVDAGLRISQRVTPCRAFGLVFHCFVGDSDARQSIVRVDDLGELLGPID